MDENPVINWPVIDATCPEFRPNIWTVVFAIIAIIGCVFNVILSFRFKKEQKRSSCFLNTLSGFDFVICFFYLWVYSLASLATAYQIDFLADLRIEAQIALKTFVSFYESAMTLILLFIILERYLWTCPSRTRLMFKMFTVKTPKYWLFLGTIFYVLVSTLISLLKGVQLSNVPFCDVALCAIEYENSTLHFIQSYLFPGILGFTRKLTMIFATLTALRLSKVGQGEQPVHQGEINLSFSTEQASTISIPQVKRSIICMLVVAVTFFIRAIACYLLIDPYTSSMYTKSMGDRYWTMWWYDTMSLVFSASRYLVYYLICKDQMVVEYPLNGLGR